MARGGSVLGTNSLFDESQHGSSGRTFLFRCSHNVLNLGRREGISIAATALFSQEGRSRCMEGHTLPLSDL